MREFIILNKKTSLDKNIFKLINLIYTFILHYYLNLEMLYENKYNMKDL